MRWHVGGAHHAKPVASPLGPEPSAHHVHKHSKHQAIREKLQAVEATLKNYAISSRDHLAHASDAVAASRDQLLFAGRDVTTQAMNKLRSFPDWGRRSIRLSICLLTFGLLGHAVNWDAEWADRVRQSCNWAGITCIVVTAPLIGKVAEVSVFRIVGTIVGGGFGYLMYQLGLLLLGSYGAGIFITCVAPIVVVPTTYLAFKHSADQLSKFVQLTYIIVAYAAKPEKTALLLASLRVGGIIAGGVLSLVLAVVVLPRSATVESCREMKKALRACVDLNRAVWAASNNPVPSEQRMNKKKGVMARMADMPASKLFTTSQRLFMPGSLNSSRPSEQDLAASSQALHSLKDSAEAQREGEVEKIVQQLYSSLTKVEEMLVQTKTEIYVHHLWGSYFFLPSILPLDLYGWKFPILGKWRLPIEDMQTLITCIRRITRLLWSILLDFEEGWDATMQDVLAAYYPKALMSELSTYCHKSLLDLHNAFPSAAYIDIDNLMNLGQIVECLIQISDTRNRAAVFQQRKRRPRASTTASKMGSRGLSIQDGSGPMPLQGMGSNSLDSNASNAAQDEEAKGAALPSAPSSANPQFLSRSLSNRFGVVKLMDLPPRRLLRALPGGGEPSYEQVDTTMSSFEFVAQLATSQQPSQVSWSDHDANHDADHDADYDGISRGHAANPMRPVADLKGATLLPQIMEGTEALSRQDSPAVSKMGRRGGSNSPFASQADMDPEGEVMASFGAAYMAGHSRSAQHSPFSSNAALDGLGARQPAPLGSSSALDTQITSRQPHRLGAKSNLRADSAAATQAGTRQEFPDSALALPRAPTEVDACEGVETQRAQPPPPPAAPCPPQPMPPGLPDSARASLQLEGESLPLMGAQAGASDAPLGSLKIPGGHTSSPGPHPLLLPALHSSLTPPFHSHMHEPLGSQEQEPLLSESQSAVRGPPVRPSHEGSRATNGLDHLPNIHQQPSFHQTGSAASGQARQTPQLESMLSHAIYDPVTFPPTAEGYVSQVRWHSLQWLLDELVEELEEAFLAISIVMGHLPYPIK